MSYLRDVLLNRGIVLDKVAASADIENFIQRFRENYVSVDLSRIGGDGDGGYLTPDIFESVSHCFSPGVDRTANFESQLSKNYGIQSFMADASVDESPISDPNLHFTPKFLGNVDSANMITLNSWMAKSLDGSERELVLQMDIEGSEYDVLAFESAETLRKFSVMIVEFHNFERFFDRLAHRMFSSIFEKIYQDFSICHVHPNNVGGLAKCHGFEVPRLLEITFLRKDHCAALDNGQKISVPHELDRINVASRPDVTMPTKWWQS